MLILPDPEALPHRYRLYGHVLAAPQPLHGLVNLAVPDATAPDARIYVGTIATPEHVAFDEQVAYAITPEAVYLAYPGVGRFVLMDDGLGIEPDPAAPESLWQRWLLGPMLGLWLQRRGHVVLHANAVALQDQALLFLGDSGQGKTTLTQALIRHDAHLITDDVAVLNVPAEADATVSIAPGPPWLKLTDATWSAFHATPFAPSIEGKASVAVADSQLITRHVPVAALFVLSVGDAVGCMPLAAAEQMLALQRHAHMPRALPVLGTATHHFQQSGRLAQRVPCYTLQRSRSLADLPQLVSAVQKVATSLTR